MLRVQSALLVFLLALFSTTAVNAVDLASSMGTMENIFPDRYDAELAELYRPEDRIVFIFREMTLAQFNQSQKIEPLLNSFLKKALNRYWLLESTEYKRAFQSDSAYFTRRVQKYLKKLPSTYDQAAFAFVFSALIDKNAQLKPLEMSSQAALQSLKEFEHQKEYAARIAGSRDFYRRIPMFFKPAIKLEEKVASMIEKLQQKFILEKMILAVDSLVSQKSGKMREAFSKLKGKLARRLHEKILENLEIQLETGLEKDAVTGIAKSSQGVMVCQVLYQGRIRVFVKEMQKAENIRQLNCFIPILTSIKSDLSALRNRVSDPGSGATLEKMQKNLEQMATILKLKLRNKVEDSQNFRQLVEQFDREMSVSEHEEILLSL
ncbi:MAG: hypothetical protein CVV42_02630 [Candidatus Riflebacteria bacterium HGW-Riflebacteria-2]|jgi:hypothetical protein|nr:MAG: hypothetical protein CVV42_02630 [Candidatus Riflebacteria bacterium HGW-Riflebacteria-2]